MTIGRIPSVEGGIQPTIVDAKGDLIAGVAADSVNRLAVGSNGTVLTADSSTSTGLTWTGVNQMANPVINGGMDVWQRGTTFSNANVNTYTADRWTYGRGSNVTGQTVSRQTVSDTTNLPNIQYSMRSQRQSGNAATDNLYIMQTVESTNCTPFVGKTITFSYYARAGANYSMTSNSLNVYFASGTGTDQSLWSGYTGQSALVNTNITLTTTWQRFAHSFTIAATATQFGFYFMQTPTGTASTNDWFEVTGVQIDIGTYTAATAPTFRRSGGTLQGELAACQRYYYRSTPNLQYGTHASGMGEATTTAQIIFPVPVQMRTTVSSVEYSNLRLQDTNAGYAVTNVVLLNSGGNFQICLRVTVASGLTLYRPYVLDNNNNSAGYLGVSAEL